MLGTPFSTVAVSESPPEAAAGFRRLRLREGFAHVARIVRLWASRSRERRALADLADAAEVRHHLLLDIGISRGEARSEGAKPFWRP